VSFIADRRIKMQKREFLIKSLESLKDAQFDKNTHDYYLYGILESLLEIYMIIDEKSFIDDPSISEMHYESNDELNEPRGE
jgi:hypothetical protein